MVVLARGGRGGAYLDVVWGLLIWCLDIPAFALCNQQGFQFFVPWSQCGLVRGKEGVESGGMSWVEK